MARPRTTMVMMMTMTAMEVLGALSAVLMRLRTETHLNHPPVLEQQDHHCPAFTHRHQDRVCQLMITTEMQKVTDSSGPGTLQVKITSTSSSGPQRQMTSSTWATATPATHCICGHCCKLLLEICAERYELLVAESSASEDPEGHSVFRRRNQNQHCHQGPYSHRGTCNRHGPEQ